MSHDFNLHFGKDMRRMPARETPWWPIEVTDKCEYCSKTIYYRAECASVVFRQCKSCFDQFTKPKLKL